MEDNFKKTAENINTPEEKKTNTTIIVVCELDMVMYTTQRWF